MIVPLKTHKFQVNQWVYVLKLNNGQATLTGPYKIMDIQLQYYLVSKLKIADLTWVTARQCIPQDWIVQQEAKVET